jgi:hypothetical protein
MASLRGSGRGGDRVAIGWRLRAAAFGGASALVEAGREVRRAGAEDTEQR